MALENGGSRRARAGFRQRPCIGLAAALALILQAAPSDGADRSWQERDYPYVVVESSVRDVLEEFGRNMGLTMRIADDVQGRVRGEIPALSARAFLDRLARDHDLLWYYDGFVLDISTRDALRTGVLDGTGVSLDRLRREMDLLDIFDERFDLRGSRDTELIYVSGPPRYVALVEQTLNRMREIAARPVGIVRGSSAGATPGNGLEPNVGVLR